MPSKGNFKNKYKLIIIKKNKSQIFKHFMHVSL